MIHIRLMGGLGNQLFQYALGKELAHRGRTVQFDRETLYDMDDLPHHPLHTQYSLDGFHTKPLRFGTPQGREVNDWRMPFQPEVLEMDDDIYLHGHWQCEKYFPSVVDELRAELVPVSFPTHVQAIGKMLRESNSVVLQVRRADYLDSASLLWHGVMSKEYYLEALEIVKPQHIAVIGDDDQWCQENLPGITISTHNRWADMWLIGQAWNAIIANSSFGWWGAWIGDKNRMGRVVAPKKWFVTEQLDSKDICPERWQLL